MARISNLKISVKCHGCFSPRFLNTDSKRNFSVIRRKFTYIIFKVCERNQESGQHVNITKIRTFGQVKESLHELKTMLLWGEISTPIIDNITASFDLGRHLILNSVYLRLKKLYKSVRYCPQRFPGLFLKINLGSALIFSSGKVCLVGFKHIEDIEKTEQAIKKSV